MIGTTHFVNAVVQRRDLARVGALRIRMPAAHYDFLNRLERFAEPQTILTRTPRTLEGAPSEVVLPYLARFVGTTVVVRPDAYLVPPALAKALVGHGLRVEPADGARRRQTIVPMPGGTVRNYGEASTAAPTSPPARRPRARHKSGRPRPPSVLGLVFFRERP